MLVLVLGGGYYLYSTGKLDEILNKFKLPAQSATPTPAPQQKQAAPKVIRRHHPAQAPGTPTSAPAPTGPTTGLSGSKTGKTIYPVIAPIANTGDVTIRGGGNSFRDNIGYPCNKCARESSWIFSPGTGGDWSLKLGSHGDEGGKETLIELGNIDTGKGGGEWQCEGPHMTYKGVSGGSGKAPAIAGKPQVGAKAVTWPLGGNKVHHEIWMDMTGTGNSWQKVAEFSGAATGCNAITCPVPGSKCQDTLRMDGPKGHKFISRSMVEIRPGGGAGAAKMAAVARVTAPY